MTKTFEQLEVALCSFWGNDRAAANAAWASTYDQAKADSKSDHDVMRVVTGLVSQHHDTPKERVWMEFFITCPIFIERQFDKYRMTLQFQDYQIDYMYGPMGRDNITQNELSGRYRTIPDRPYVLPQDVCEIIARVSLNKDKVITGGVQDAAEEVREYWNDLMVKQHEEYQAALKGMKEAEKNGAISNAEYKRAREVLRGLLGTAFLTDMRIVMNMNAFEHIVNQRIAAASQVESQIIAMRMVEVVRKQNVCPTMLEEMVKANGWDVRMKEIQESFVRE